MAKKRNNKSKRVLTVVGLGVLLVLILLAVFATQQPPNSQPKAKIRTPVGKSASSGVQVFPRPTPAARPTPARRGR